MRPVDDGPHLRPGSAYLQHCHGLNANEASTAPTTAKTAYLAVLYGTAAPAAAGAKAVRDRGHGNKRSIVGGDRLAKYQANVRGLSDSIEHVGK
jgi:hypothetical protein